MALEEFLSVKLTGLEELKAQLKKLDATAQRQIYRNALRKSANKIKEEAISRAPRRYGFLKASIKARVRLKQGNLIATVSAGNNKAWYAHLVEWGFQHTARKTIRDSEGRLKTRPGAGKVTSRGRVEGKGYMRKSMESNFDFVMEQFVADIGEAVDRHIKKQATLKR